MTTHVVYPAKWPSFHSPHPSTASWVRLDAGMLLATIPRHCAMMLVVCSILSSVLARHRTLPHITASCEGDKKGMSMKGSSYRERDYAFGRVMLTLRTRLELTQTALADILGVRRRAVIDWEGGLTYPKADHLKQFVVLATQHQAFPVGREAEEVRALWQAARQKVLLDEAWLGGLLSHLQAHPASQPGEETSVTADALASPSRGGPRVDWGDALAV